MAQMSEEATAGDRAGCRLTGERPLEGVTPDSLLALHAAGYRTVIERLERAGCSTWAVARGSSRPGSWPGTGRWSASTTARTRSVARRRWSGSGLVVGPDERPRARHGRRILPGPARRTSSSISTDPEGHVRELARVLADGGTAFFLTPNAPADFENPFHVHLFDPDELGALLGRHFHDVRVQGLDAVPAGEGRLRRAAGPRPTRCSGSTSSTSVTGSRGLVRGDLHAGAPAGLQGHGPRRFRRRRPGSRPTTSSSPTSSTRPPWSCSPRPPGRGGRPERRPRARGRADRGDIGAGKSTVAGLLVAHGAALVDADRVAREVVEPGGPAYEQVVERFGRQILDPDERIDRPALAALVFGHPEALADLNAIVHPAIGVAMIARKDAYRRQRPRGRPGHPPAQGGAQGDAVAGRGHRGRHSDGARPRASGRPAGHVPGGRRGPGWPPNPIADSRLEGADLVVDNSG